ncbi:TIGR02391 family protein [Candidatus Jorgensenbacteria bacterium RIFCSPLOWO2_02_FULL_45_12]|uniref:Conserved hypothetical protein CHP02391 domain-containing protein n=1 Tax=Candidatus Jorgensenbacteria bacterium GW2011_GWA2_45_9 TaxID=1618663 RepID=A0A0G1N108_9BACT|nr:MAG: hypothetical protein UX22_C0029G0012 [Candidatus Jorgensenbacteria bacterium GW2011_GWA2_45_9]OGG42242.1 MAG: TIGR02391 family protein [Candidatus Jorgensenbacteria bacterium RIFCSPLOWO2_02_FULL_45_12]
MNYRLIAIQIGDLLKYDSTVNDINRAAQSVFNFRYEKFPNDSITSTRAQLIHDWILSLAKQEMNNTDRNKKLTQFLDLIVPESCKECTEKILKQAGVVTQTENESSRDFSARNFHPEIHKHCSRLYSQGNYFHAVFEAAKVYNKKVQEKAQSNNDGQSLMMEAWTTNGVLKITACKTETDKNVQEGIKFLSAGLMQAMRNPTAHEPALDWPISKEDCLDMLSFISYLFRQLDRVVYYNGSK